MPRKKGYFDSSIAKKLIIILAILCTFLFLLFVRFHVDQHISGDEPHYLLMDYSLQHDHDLNLKNNYLNPHDSSSFYPGLSPFGQVDPYQLSTNSPKLYSIHGIGVPILLLPFFILNGVKGTEVEMVVIATILVCLTGFWCYVVTRRVFLSCLTAGALTLCYFFNGLAGYIYPDMIIGGVTLGCLMILYRRYDKLIYQLMFGALIGSLVFLHSRNLVIVLPLFVLIVYRCWSHKKKLPWAVLLTAAPLLVYFFLSLHHWYGVWSPDGIYQSNIRLNQSPLETVPAMLFDSKLGLLVYNPIILLVIVGIFPWIKRNKTSFTLVALSLILSIFVLTIFNGWDGGGSPQGRYFIDFLPAFMPAMVFTLELVKKWWQKIAVIMLVAITLLITVENIILKFPYDNDFLPKQRASLFVGLQNQIGIAFDKVLPKYSTRSTRSTFISDKHGLLIVSIDTIGLLSLAGYGYVLAKPLKSMHED